MHACRRRAGTDSTRIRCARGQSQSACLRANVLNDRPDGNEAATIPEIEKAFCTFGNEIDFDRIPLETKSPRLTIVARGRANGSFDQLTTPISIDGNRLALVT